MQVLIEKDVPAEMRDGVTLMSNVYRPYGRRSIPVLLARHPYGKDLTFGTSMLDPIKAAAAGYIVVVQDVRGRYRSEGKFVPFVREYEDGYDTVEWAAGLPGSDGSVGMYGLSYFGKTQWHAAVMRPPSLKSMAPAQTWGNHLDGVQMRGGVQELGLMQFWAQVSLTLDLLFRKYAGDREKIGEMMPHLISTIDELLAGGGYEVLPLKEPSQPGRTGPLRRGRLRARRRRRGLGLPQHRRQIRGRGRAHLPHRRLVRLLRRRDAKQYEAMKKLSDERDTRPPRLWSAPGRTASSKAPSATSTSASGAPKRFSTTGAT